MKVMMMVTVVRMVVVKVVRMVMVMVVRTVVTMLTVMAMLLISAKPSLSTYYARSKFVSSLYPHHNPGR